MKSVYRNVCYALALIVAMLGAPLAQAGDAGGTITLAMSPAPLGSPQIAPTLVQPVLLCGNRWVKGDYVLPNNCLKACLNSGHSAVECKDKLVPLCEGCWKELLACAKAGNAPQAVKCTNCSEHYAKCMAVFLK